MFTPSNSGADITLQSPLVASQFLRMNSSQKAPMQKVATCFLLIASYRAGSMMVVFNRSPSVFIVSRAPKAFLVPSSEPITTSPFSSQILAPADGIKPRRPQYLQVLLVGSI